MPDEANQPTEERQLRRLEVLVDSVYALVIVLLVAGLPTPREVDWSGDSPWEFLIKYRDDYTLSVFGMVLIVSYWLQNNAVFGSLRKTDNRHTVFAIVQVFFLLTYLFSAALGVDFQMHPTTLAIQSGSLLLMGVMSVIGWRYATRDRRLLASEVSEQRVDDLSLGMLPEPTTAALTLGAAPFGETAWGVTWLAFPVLAWLLNRYKLRRRESREA